MGRSRLNLTGNKYGKLTVVGPNGISNEGHTLWDCICECGKWLLISCNSLTSSGTKSCRRCSQLKDISGQKFGKLTAIKRAKREKSGISKWICRCECGNFTQVTINHLTTGHTKSCGNCPLNNFYVKDGYCEGITSKGKKFFFDKEDWNMVTTFNWYIDAKGYVVAMNGKRVVRLHRLLMNPDEGIQIDHINRNKKDCRRSNLRFALNKENCANSATYKTNKSTGHKNVYAVGNLYRVIIRKDGIAQNFGYYRDLKEAIRIANISREKLFGEFAYFDESL